MSKKVIKFSELSLHDVDLQYPQQTDTKTKFSKSEDALVQTCEMTFSYNDDMLEVLCTPEYADVIHQIDHLICTKISDNSTDWFNKNITYDQVERMFRPTLQGGRNPRQMLIASSFKAFDSETVPMDRLPASGSGIFILKLDGVRFEEKVCEAQWSVVQAKECLPTVPVPSPMFVN